MNLTADQKKKVEENMGLVWKVINDKLSLYHPGLYSKEDLYQIGCIGLCKAAATDKGGCFSTYAYRIIWNEICDSLIYSSRRKVEFLEDESFTAFAAPGALYELPMDLYEGLKKVSGNAPISTRKGILALILMSQGYSSREIGDQMGASANLVCAWISKARTFLKRQPQMRQIAAAYLL